MADAADRPNVILIMVDDMGFSDIGCYGSEIATPNIDALAAGGIRFSQFYNSARCCPTRASLLTGLHPHQAGIGHMTVDFEVAPYRGFLNQNCVTIAEALGSAGYTTLMAGKWHAGGDYPFSRWKDVTAGDATHPTPRQRGFQHFYGTLAGSGSFFDPHTLMRDDEYIEPEDYGDYYYTDAIAANAAGFIEEHGQGDAPFFCTSASPRRTGRCTPSRKTSKSIAGSTPAAGTPSAPPGMRSRKGWGCWIRSGKSRPGTRRRRTGTTWI